MKKIITLLSLCLLLTFPANAQFETRPTPMWENYQKTEADTKSDDNFIQQAIKLANGDREGATRALVDIGWERIGEGDPNHAIRAFNQAWLLQPENPNVFWGFAVASHIRGDEVKKINRFFNRSRQLTALNGFKGSARLEADHGRALEERKCYKEARPYFEKALSLKPNYIPAHIGMMNVAKGLGETELFDKHKKLHDELVK